MSVVISVENVSKIYRLGSYDNRTLQEEIQRWWAGLRGRPDPVVTIDHMSQLEPDHEMLWALRNVSFEIKQGETVAVIGRNGAGKSTLLKILSRITLPSEGEIKIKGRISSLLEVGTGFHPELTGRENIYLNGSIMGMKRADISHKLDQIVEFSGVSQFIDTPVKRYSSGMYMRLAFSVAAHLDPDILIVDEVLAVGDLNFQRKSLGKMEEVAQSGRTVILVSHNLYTLKQFAQRAILLNSGKIELDDKAESVIAAYSGESPEAPKLIAEKIWAIEDTAPGNNIARLDRVVIKNQKNIPSTKLFSGENISVEIDTWNQIDSAKLSNTIVLYNEDGEIVFSTISNHDKKWHGQQRKIGLYRSICQIPANFLSPGLYGITVIICTNGYSDFFQADNVIRFEVTDSGDVRGDFIGGYSGIVRPLLEWKTFLVEPEKLTAGINK